MTEKTKSNPYGIDPARDLHHSPPRWDVENWSENLLFAGVDADNGTFFYHHLGLVNGAPDVWRGDFAFCYPDGRQLLQVTFGNDEAGNVISDGTLRCECIEPLKSWRITWEGAAYLTDAETNRNNFLAVDQLPVGVKFDIRWEGTVPMHEAKRGGELVSGFNTRYEQAGQYYGTLEVNGERMILNGYGYRDHSVGPRHYKDFTGHVWHVGVFPSGKMFGALVMDENHELKWGAPYVALEDGELREADYVSGPWWKPEWNDYDEKTYEFVITVEGQEHRIQGENLGYGYYWTCMDPSQLNYGMDPKRAVSEQMWLCREIVTKWTWDGEETLGFIEISRRVGQQTD
jgi:hypothetical protein